MIHFGMIYCIGHTENYRRSIAEQLARGEQPVKVGKCDDLPGYTNSEPYPGGSVWRTPEEAEQWLETLGPQWTEGGKPQPRTPQKFSVFGVDADWEKDTEPDPVHSFHNLLRDAPLLDLQA